MSGRKKHGSSKKPLTHGWICVPSKTYPDRVYFYNTITKCSTWENPCETKNQSLERSSSESSSPKRSKSKKSSTRNQKRQKRNKLIIQEEIGSVNDEIRDYDEETEQYFEKISTSPISHYRDLNSPGSPDSFFLPITPTSKSNTSTFSDKNELWLQFATCSKNPDSKKSVALSDLNGPSTSNKSSEGNKNKRQSPSQSLSVGRSTFVEEVPKKESDSDGKKKKRKKKRPLSEASKNKNCDKTLNNVILRKRDKTPAQTHLLKFRHQNAELLKQAANQIDSDNFKTQNSSSHVSKLSIANVSNGVQANCANFSKEFNVCNETQEKLVDDRINDFSEEMDWEPSSEELDVQNINVFRQRQEKGNKISGDIFLGLMSDATPSLPSVLNSWILVLDTNIFVSCLSFVKDLRDTSISGLGFPILYIPWRVLQELDHLKDSKIDTFDHHLLWNVRRAIAYLNDNFKARHPRCVGQSFEDFFKMVDSETSAPDDEILQTCIKLQKLHSGKKLTLLTNDKNLESKAIISGIEVYSKETFQKKFLSSEGAAQSQNSSFFSNGVNLTQIDNVVCALKTLLKSFLPLMVETEMKMAFQNDWVKLAFRKPPWTLQDALDCFIKHWRSVFFLIFSRDALVEAEKLSAKLFKNELVTSADICETINIIQRFLTHISQSKSEERPYTDLLKVTMKKLSELLEDFLSKTSQGNKEKSFKNQSLLPPESSFSLENRFYVESEQIPQVFSDAYRAKNLFRDIWESLRNFCCSYVSGVLNSSVTNNNLTVPEIRLKISHILNEISELVFLIEKIFDIDLKDLKEDHPSIFLLSNFLLQMHPNMEPETKTRLPQCLTAFFTDMEGRSMLSGSLIDFKDFCRDLVKVADHLDRNSTKF